MTREKVPTALQYSFIVPLYSITALQRAWKRSSSSLSAIVNILQEKESWKIGEKKDQTHKCKENLASFSPSIYFCRTITGWYGWSDQHLKQVNLVPHNNLLLFFFNTDVTSMHELVSTDISLSQNIQNVSVFQIQRTLSFSIMYATKRYLI